MSPQATTPDAAGVARLGARTAGSGRSQCRLCDSGLQTAQSVKAIASAGPAMRMRWWQTSRRQRPTRHARSASWSAVRQLTSGGSAWPLKRQCSHARTSRSTAGSVQCERQLEFAAGLASTQVFAGRLQALGARFGDEWAPARLAAQARSSPKAGLTSVGAETRVCIGTARDRGDRQHSPSAALQRFRRPSRDGRFPGLCLPPSGWQLAIPATWVRANEGRQRSDPDARGTAEQVWRRRPPQSRAGRHARERAYVDLRKCRTLSARFGAAAEGVRRRPAP